ncbi:tRNA lysidine(34) synthetase TilS [Oceanobacillus polygoni]|uniref:tRNA(Ile)-lysidine synthase n=1 Tax=Oceanobacillus polygoni TaxID=1235259 RepID=A0A9X0YTU3_9BACI|nr:tRNA lysidine(34) synthetase TilS [Oceanobacillus polygoni]MBP2078514.1 tRNA(Ile)-lysidine synthase [Oceanobacillus polygoni]
MRQEVLAFIRKHQLLKEGATIIVGVSGGPDSMALLHFLSSIQEEWKLTVIAASVDHQLRGEESLSDLHYVEHICKAWGIEFVGASLDVPAYKVKHKLGTEVAAREVRYRFFAEQMDCYRADYLALGHHGDDQIETMLMKLTRTASSSALTGIPVQRAFSTGMIIRPFLCVTKDMIETYCKKNQIEVRLDPTNDQTVYTRNYYRNKIVPLIKERNDNLHRMTQHLSETLAEDEKYLREAAGEMVDELITFHAENKTAFFDVNLFKNRSQALQRRAFHLILNYLYNDLPKDLSYTHEEQFFALLQRDEGNTQIDFPNTLKLENSYGKMMFYFSNHSKAPNSLPYSFLLDIPGKLVLPDGSTITANFVEKHTVQDQFSHTFFTEQVVLPLHIRTRMPGDRMSWDGLNGSKKLKDIFIDAKIPIRERDSWPIVTDANGTVLWLIGLKKSQLGSQQENGSIIQLNFEKGNF